jgi:hypothetical protein
MDITLWMAGLLALVALTGGLVRTVISRGQLQHYPGAASTCGLSPPFRFQRRDRPPVYSITGARRGLRDDVNTRTRRYLVSMGIRTACFLLAVVTDGWLRWVLIAATVLLPYFAVVFANSGRERIENFSGLARSDVRKAIDGPASP